MEPLNCTARFADGRCALWLGATPGLVVCRCPRAACVAELVTVHTTLLGGGRTPPRVTSRCRRRIARNSQARQWKLIWSRRRTCGATCSPSRAGKARRRAGRRGMPMRCWPALQPGHPRFRLAQSRAAVSAARQDQHEVCSTSPTPSRIIGRACRGVQRGSAGRQLAQRRACVQRLRHGMFSR